MPRACVVIPAKNEEKSIAKVLGDVRAGFEGTPYAEDVVCIVVDDSTDGTRRVAMENGAVVVRGGADGLGTAMYVGLKSSLEFDPDVIVAIDGDGQVDCQEIRVFLDEIAKGAELVLGSRFKKPGLVDYRYKFINRFGTRVLVKILRQHTGLELTDSHGGIRAMVPEVVRELEILGTHTYVQETIIDAAQKGFRIVEIPSVWKQRKHGGSRVVSSIPKYVFYTLPILLLRSGQHIRALYSAGLVMLVASVGVFLAVLLQEDFSFALIHRTPAFVFIAMLVSIGFQFLFFGFVLQLLKQIKKSVDRSRFISESVSKNVGAGFARKTADEPTNSESMFTSSRLSPSLHASYAGMKRPEAEAEAEASL